MPILSKETAETQVLSLLEYYEFNLEALPQQLQAPIESALGHIERGVMAGRLEIEVEADTCVVKQHLKKAIAGFPNPIVYREVSGKAKIAIKDDSTTYGKIYAFLGALSGEGAAIYQTMKGKDLSLAEALGSLFLQV
jgi:hypothetical protein